MEYWEKQEVSPQSALDRMIQLTDAVLVESLINDGIAFGDGPEEWRETEEIVSMKLRDCLEAERDRDHAMFTVCAEKLVNYLVRNMEAVERQRVEGGGNGQ